MGIKSKIKEKHITNDASTEVQTELERESLRMLELADKTADDLKKEYTKLEMLENSDEDKSDSKLKYYSYKRAEVNLFHAYRKMLVFNDELGARLSDLKNSRRKRRFLPHAPANSVVDLEELASGHFASGLNYYKLALICFAGSIFGVIIELLWCIAKNGYIESRSGLVYGPFNLLYGFAAVVLTASLYNLRNHSKLPTFLGAFFIGSVLEYACSWAQELLIGSVSWDYSSKPFNINGRICLLYSLFWGILGVLWVKDIYPRISKLILKIPERAGKIITVSLTVFLIIDAIVTCIAVFRWSRRLQGIMPSNDFWKFIDLRFTDERMKNIFPNMEFK